MRKSTAPVLVRLAMTCLMLVVFMSATAIRALAADNTVVLDDYRDEYLLGPHLQLLEDPGQALHLSDITQSDIVFKPSNTEIPNFGVTPSAYWAKVKLQNRSSKRVVWYLEYADAMLQYLDVHIIDSQDRVRTALAGSMRRKGDQIVNTYSRIFRLEIPANDHVMVYMRAATAYALIMPTKVWHPPAFGRQNQMLSALHGLFLGTCIAMFFYNLFIFVTTKDILYFHYIAYVAATVAAILCLNGTLGNSLLKDYPYLCNFIFMPSHNIFIFFHACLTVGLLAGNHKIWKKIPIAIALVSVILIALVIAGYIKWWVILTPMISFIVGIAFLVLAAKKLAEARTIGFYYIVGFGSFFVGGLIYALVCNGLIEYSLLTYNAMEIGATAQVFMLSIALATRIRDIKEQHQKTQMELIAQRKKLLALAEHQKQQLELEVEARTHDVIHAQQTLVYQKRISVLGTMTAGIAHEINNPNNFISAGIQNVEASIAKFSSMIDDIIDSEEHSSESRQLAAYFEQLRDGAADILFQSQRIGSLVKDLGIVSRHHQANDAAYALDQGLNKTLQILDAEGADIVADIQPCPPIRCQAAEINQAILNIVDNARHAIRQRADTAKTGRINVSLKHDEREGMLRLVIQDNGCGMTADVLARACNPLFTTHGETSAGLGLSIAHDIMVRHHGRLDIASMANVGTTVTLSIPVIP